MSSQGPANPSRALDPKFFRVDFLGGPLDGASMVTDVQPNSERFIHRSQGRTYVYRYSRVNPERFRAIFELDSRVDPSNHRLPALTAAQLYQCICQWGITLILIGILVVSFAAVLTL